MITLKIKEKGDGNFRLALAKPGSYNGNFEKFISKSSNYVTYYDILLDSDD